MLGLDMLAGIATVVSLAVSVAGTAASVGMQQKALKRAAKREKQAAGMRADERRERLRRALAAQRVAMISQGSVPDVGSGQVLSYQAIIDAARDTQGDLFQTEGTLEDIKNQKMSSILSGVGAVGQTMLQTSSAYRDTRLGKTGG